MKILLVEDDTLLGESVVEFLEGEELEVRWLRDGRDIYFEDLALYDVVVLDLMLGFVDGRDLIPYIKEKGNVPVLVLTAKREITDKEICFERGADDYLTKPFEPKELLLRIRALARRKTGKKVRIGNVVVEIDRGIVTAEGKEINLSKTAWKLLYFLLKHKGEIVEKERILRYVWGGKAVGDEVLRAYIKELRKKLPGDLIETHKGRGYRLKDEV